MTAQRASGFALLEAVVATAIVSLVVLAVLAALGAQLRASQGIGPSLIAAEIGREKLMSLRLIPPELLRSLPDSLAAGVVDTPGGQYFWRTSSEEVADRRALLQMTVRVSGNGQFTASTYFFDPSHALSRR
jgi:type II secretion system protein I